MEKTHKLQQIVWGVDALNDLCAATKARKALLVADASFPYLSIRQEVENIAVPYVLFTQFSPNPLYEDVCNGVDLFKEQSCDLIIAVGGGSSMDVAKCIKLFCRMDPERNYLMQEGKDSGIPLIAIPTTAGTGSESTRFAVIYYEGKKQSVNHLSIIPDYAVLDPRVLLTLPLYQKKCTVLDAYCQGIESWWSVNATDVSQVHSRRAVEMLTEYIPDYIRGNEDRVEALRIAQKVMEAANLAGQAINLTQTTAPHAFSYKLTSLYHLPHGHAVAVCLPEIWKYMLKHPEQCMDSRGWSYLEEVFQQIAIAMHCVSAADAIVSFNNLLQQMEMDFPKAEKREEEISCLSTSVNPLRLKNNPVVLDEAAIRALYETIVK